MNQSDNYQYIKKIRNKLEVMTQSKYRTTNFSLIEYFAKHNFQALNIEDLTMILSIDYKANPTKYVLTKDNNHFKSEKTFINSIKTSISKNKAFVKGPGIGQLTLNLPKTLEYLETMYNKYKNNSKDIKTPVKLSKSKNHDNKKKKLNVINLMEDNTNNINDDDESDYEM